LNEEEEERENAKEEEERENAKEEEEENIFITFENCA
jgi:hypothetical protein